MLVSSCVLAARQPTISPAIPQQFATPQARPAQQLGQQVNPTQDPPASGKKRRKSKRIRSPSPTPSAQRRRAEQRADDLRDLLQAFAKPDIARETFVDSMSGAKTPLVQLCPGLRIPEFMDVKAIPLYPHLWLGNAPEFAVSMRDLLTEYNGVFPSTQVKESFDLDLDVIAELLSSGIQRTKKHELRTLFLLSARVLATIIAIAPLGGQLASEQYLTAFHKSWDEGRLDLLPLFKSKLSTVNQKAQTATTVVPTTPSTNTAIATQQHQLLTQQLERALQEIRHLKKELEETQQPRRQTFSQKRGVRGKNNRRGSH